ncbi:MAG: RDD family protein [Dehalococcoidia bacterium]|nr:MAG: RDD family protein [Dehalococcoidia bacterium]
MSFDSPSAGPGPRWTGDGSLRPRRPVPEDAPDSPAHRTFRDAGLAGDRPRTVEVAGVTMALASPLRRTGGFVIDFVIKAIVMQMLVALVLGSTEVTFELLVAAQIWGRGYDAIFFAQGWTPGSRLMRMRIVRLQDGGAPGMRWGTMRAAGSVISETVLLLGYVWMLWDPRRQTWHDKLAGTVVVEAPR